MISKTPGSSLIGIELQVVATPMYSFSSHNATFDLVRVLSAGTRGAACIDKGFDATDYRFSRAEITVAGATVQRFVERATRLYEQERAESRETTLLGRHEKVTPFFLPFPGGLP